MNSFITSLTVFVLLICQHTFAYDNAALDQWLQQQVEFRDCEVSEGRQPVHMEQFFVNTVKEGMQSLDLINPELTTALVDRLISEPLTVSCDEQMDEIAVASTFMSNRIRFGRVRVPTDQWVTHERISKIYTFHEVLHIAGADNFSTRVHNRADNTSKDVVYSCSVSAFTLEGRGGAKAAAQRQTCEAAYMCGRQTCVANSN